MPDEYQYQRYLESKRSVDDRALHRPVLERLRAELAGTSRPRVLELGGGTGSMVRRVIDWSLLRSADYTLVDHDHGSLASLPSILQTWARERKDPVWVDSNEDDLVVSSEAIDFRVKRKEAELGQFLRDHGEDGRAEPYVLIIAHAVLDLVNIATVLPTLWTCCAPNALFWFTVNFDGESVFLPADELDEPIFEAYHDSMNRRPGSRYAGRGLFAELNRQSALILAAGSSDWVVHPQNSHYDADEAYFLHHIVHTIDEELSASPPIPALRFREWIEARHRQIHAGELIYVAHQLDFVGRIPPRRGA